MAIELTGGGRMWWMPIGAEDHVPVTETVMSYELDGELRLTEGIEFSSMTLPCEPDQPCEP